MLSACAPVCSRADHMQGCVNLPAPCPCSQVVTRYLQWSLTTPTLVYVVSRISNFGAKRVACVVSAQSAVIMTGLLAALSPGWQKCECYGQPEKPEQRHPA